MGGPGLRDIFEEFFKPSQFPSPFFSSLGQGRVPWLGPILLSMTHRDHGDAVSGRDILLFGVLQRMGQNQKQQRRSNQKEGLRTESFHGVRVPVS